LGILLVTGLAHAEPVADPVVEPVIGVVIKINASKLYVYDDAGDEIAVLKAKAVKK